MSDSVIDLRRRAAPTLWLTALTLAVLAVLAAIGAADDAAPGTLARIGAGVFAGLCALGALALVRIALRPRRLVIDHDGIRLEVGGRRPAFRLVWTEIAAVALLVRVTTHRRRSLLRFFIARRDVGAVLELIPADAEAVRRHPELRNEWRWARERSWRVGLGVGPDRPPPVEALVRRHRAELWAGARPGSMFSA